MKKVLIGVLILIPIIIVASVLLTTNIISKNSYLPVDRVELNEDYIEFSLNNGITIGDNSVIGAGAVVTKDISSNVVAVGNPARVLREISAKDEIYYFKDKKF